MQLADVLPFSSNSLLPGKPGFVGAEKLVTAQMSFHAM